MDRDQIFGEVSVCLVVGPFVLALFFLGSTLALLSGRFLVDVVASGGRLPASTQTAR
jgi:hypothetical protein